MTQNNNEIVAELLLIGDVYETKDEHHSLKILDIKGNNVYILPNDGSLAYWANVHSLVQFMKKDWVISPDTIKRRLIKDLINE